MENSDSEFITVTRRRLQKTENIKSNTIPKQPQSLSFSELANIVYSNLKKYESSICGAFIYGSRARGTNRSDSDADIIVFWRYEYHIDFLKSIKYSIEKALGFKIDFVACIYMNKWVDHVDDRDLAYFDNVIIDAKPIIKSESITYLIDQSIKLLKL